MRLLILFVLGAALGVGVALVASNALQQRDAYPRSVMVLLQHHLAALHGMQRSARCDSAASGDLLQRMRRGADEIEPALQPPGAPDPRLQRYVLALRDELDHAIAAPAADCAALGNTVVALGERCDACHREYR